MNFLITVLIKDYSNVDIVTERSSDLPCHHFQVTSYDFRKKFLLALFILVRLFYLDIYLLDFASNSSDSLAFMTVYPGKNFNISFPLYQRHFAFLIWIFMFSSFIQTYASHWKIVRAATWSGPNLLYKYPERKNLEVLQPVIRRWEFSPGCQGFSFLFSSHSYSGILKNIATLLISSKTLCEIPKSEDMIMIIIAFVTPMRRGSSTRCISLAN